MLNLDKRYIVMIKKMLASHVPNHTVWAYGSRVKGKAHEGSDLDLVIISEDGSLTQQQLSALRNAFSESNLPILIDVLDWDTIPTEFKQEIKKDHIVIKM